ncbi:MAG TPA: ATP-binding cassette domain-containing protein [Cyclobacteriaceae bacterium]|jgi:ABC-type multidrug transport system ATPase subunit/uncharacterized tellurite resistance protein B-like protein
MSEELLKAIIQLFAIVAKERITEDERTNIREFLAAHLNHDTIQYHMKLFDEFAQYKVHAGVELTDTDEETAEFVGDWSKITEINKQINKGLTQQQKLFLIVKMIELILADGEISERQSNLIFYIGEMIRIRQKDIDDIINFVKAEEVEDLNYPNVLVIDDGTGKHKWKSKRISSHDLTGVVFFLRIEATETYFMKYLGISDLLLNGSLVKPRRIYVFPTGSNLRGSKVHPVYYSDVVSKFLYHEAKDQISFIAENIWFKFKTGDIGLQGINIAERGGKLIGLMGASGSGKSTLLHVLNGSETPTRGRVLINEVNVHRHKERVEGVIGFVPQDDFLVEELTVYQNMYYAAKLCFSQYKRENLENLINKTLKSLGLFEIKDLKVGAPLDKTISGGQRKRLNIGLELLREPNVLFVDEPTSGLSSRDSENIMDLLKELSLRGKIIFVVIHQPSSDIFKMFDSLIILDVGGYQVFYGNPVDASIYFKNQVNMVNKDQGSCPECGNINPEQIFNIIESRVVNEYGRFTEKRKIPPLQWHETFKEKIVLPQVEIVKGVLRNSLKIPGLIKQAAIFAERDVKSKISDKQYLVINLLEAPVLASFLAFLVKYYATIDVTSAHYFFRVNDNIPIFFFMSIIVSLFMGLTVSAEEIIKDKKILKRESFLHLSKASYLSSKIFILFAISAIQTLSFVLIGVWILEMKGMTFAYWMALFSTSCFANMLGLNISASFKSAVTIYILIPLLLIPQLVLSGVVVKFDKFNPRLTPMDKVPLLGELMASRWAFEALAVTQFSDNDYNEIFFEVEKRRWNSHYMSSYYVPKLESHNTEAYRHYLDPNHDSVIFAYHLSVLANELPWQLEYVGQHNAINLRRFRVSRFDSVGYNQTVNFLNQLRIMYTRRQNTAILERDSIVNQLTNTPEKEAQYRQLQDEYANEEMNNLVMNRGITVIVEKDGRLIRKAYPIYKDPEPANFFDFREQFFLAKKHFAAMNLDTFYFNLSIIWLMSILLYITLYYDLLKIVVRFISRTPGGEN